MRRRANAAFCGDATGATSTKRSHSATVPPSDFTDRVLQASEPAPSRSRVRRVWPIALAASLLAAGLGLWLGRAPAHEGTLTATARETLTLSEDTVIVAEPGTTLHWFERGDTLVVEQSNGEAFYRIDSDDAPLRVHTPAADVDVTGTCFSVQLESTSNPMSRDPRSIALGAAVAVAATVYQSVRYSISDTELVTTVEVSSEYLSWARA